MSYESANTSQVSGAGCTCPHPAAAHRNGKCTVTINHYEGASVFVRSGRNPLTVSNPGQLAYSYLCPCGGDE